MTDSADPVAARPASPVTPPSAQRGRSWLAVAFSLLAIALTLAVVSVFYAGFAIVLGCVVGFISFHYFVWGWWLGALLRAESAEDESPS